LSRDQARAAAGMPTPDCPVCGAPATDHGGIIQCTADVTHINVYDLAAVKGPVTLRYSSRPSPDPRSRPDGLTEGERTAIGWAWEHHGQWGGKGRSCADAMRRQFPWLDDAELARIALYFGKSIEFAHKDGSWPDLDVLSWGKVMLAAAVELAQLEMGSHE
jgi:hypothetical protein